MLELFCTRLFLKLLQSNLQHFDHNLDQLKEIASLASEIGAERFVLDDGWFKDRNSAKSSLGDWVVDKKKLAESGSRGF